MRFYNLLFVGLLQIADKTEYKGISEYVAAFGLGLIIVLNFILIVGLTTPAPRALLSPYLTLSLFGLTIFLNVKYYNYYKDKLDKLSDDLKRKYRPNMTSGELIAILLTVESVTSILILSLSRQ